MEKSADENKGSFSSDRLISRKRNVDDENVDVELRLGLPLYGNFDVGYSKKPKILNPSNSDDNNNKKGISEFHFSLIQTSSLPLETEEEEKEREESQSLEHLEAIRKRWGKMMNIIRVDKKDEENGSGSSSSSSSGVSVFESRPQPLIQGASVGTNVRPLGSGRSLELVKKLIAAATIETTNEKSAVMLSAYNIAKARWMLRNFMIKMPRVSTRCDGPNGEKTDGLLFAYRKGVDVQIVCVCHGYFLSPAGFVKHAGGGDVENPLRHIVINPLPLW